MAKINEVKNRVDLLLNRFKPKTMDELINIVHSTTGVENYGTHFTIVKYMGYLQGVRVYITGKSKSHPLPSKDKVYSVFNGLDKYIAAGWKIENQI